jgi:hypothetical protein
MNKDKKFVLGLGTGRSGTMSLAKLFSFQNKSYFVHEGAHNVPKWLQHTTGKYLPWEVNDKAFETWFDSLLFKSKNAKYYGDVGASILPYVEKILLKEPSTRFICLKRDQSQVVASFLKITTGTNHWNNDHALRELNYFDSMFPKLSATSKEEAIKKYWDMYYEQCEHLAKKYPNSFFIFDISKLNSAQDRKQILDAAGFAAQDQLINVSVHANKSTHKFLHIIFQVVIILIELPRKLISKLFN